jgi:hypothetical protein
MKGAQHGLETGNHEEVNCSWLIYDCSRLADEPENGRVLVLLDLSGAGTDCIADVRKA